MHKMNRMNMGSSPLIKEIYEIQMGKRIMFCGFCVWRPACNAMPTRSTTRSVVGGRSIAGRVPQPSKIAKRLFWKIGDNEEG